MRETSTLVNPSEVRESSHLKYSLSIDDEKRRLLEVFLRHAQERETVHLRMLEIPPESGRTLGQERAPRNKHLQTSGSSLKTPATRADISKEIRRNRDASSCGKAWEKLLTTLETPPKTSKTSKEKRTLKIGADPLSRCPNWTWMIIQRSQISEVLRYTL